MLYKIARRHSLLCCLLGATISLCAVCPGSSSHAYTPPAANDSSSKILSETLKRGEELRRKWNLDAADVAFREAANLDPSSLDARVGLARIARARLEYPLALGFLNHALNDHRNSPELLDEYGSIYLAAEEPARARRYFENALRIFDVDSFAIMGLAGVNLLERNYDKASSLLTSLLLREPQNSADA